MWCGITLAKEDVEQLDQVFPIGGEMFYQQPLSASTSLKSVIDHVDHHRVPSANARVLYLIVNCDEEFCHDLYSASQQAEVIISAGARMRIMFAVRVTAHNYDALVRQYEDLESTDLNNWVRQARIPQVIVIGMSIVESSRKLHSGTGNQINQICTCEQNQFRYSTQTFAMFSGAP